MLLFSSITFAHAQEKAIEGFVYIDQKEAVEMALVALHPDYISANPTLFTFTDKKGYYRLNLEEPIAKQYGDYSCCKSSGNTCL